MFDDLLEGRDVFGNRMSRFRHNATTERMDRPTFLYYPSKAGFLSYTKTALWLSTLERYLGWETLQRAMATFFDRYQFAHPRPEDFFEVLNEVSGQDLTWFFDQVYRSSSHFDYAIESVTADPLDIEGLVGEEEQLAYRERRSEAAGSTVTYRSQVTVRRNGDAVFPVEVLLVFEDGTERRRSWDGESRWTLLVEDHTSPLAWAEVDPDRILLLDINRRNNSYTLEPDASFPANKLATRWISWLQDLLLTFTFFV